MTMRRSRHSVGLTRCRASKEMIWNDLLFALAGERDEVFARGTEVTVTGSVHLVAEGDELIAQRLPASGGRELVARLQQRPVAGGTAAASARHVRRCS